MIRDLFISFLNGNTTMSDYAGSGIRNSLLLTLLLLATPVVASDSLREQFLNPPEQAKPRGYWVWPHGNFDYSTIRRELEAYKAKGIGGVDIFDLGVQDRKEVIPPGPGFMSVEQIDGIAYALQQADRLGLKMGLIVSSSWNAGGTWTLPEHALMNLVSWKETVIGPLRYEKQLPFPEIPDSFSKPYGKYPLYVPKDESGLPLYFSDVAVLAYPLTADGVIDEAAQVIDLRDQVQPNGTLTCDIPAGQWVVMRIVLTNFGQRLWLPSDNSQGLTMDHFSKQATRTHFNHIIDQLQSRVGPLEKTSLERLYLASYEANTEQIWTPGFAESFEQQNGYSIQPFLPALFGETIVDKQTTERFLYDYRKTASELFLSNLYGEASRVCHEHGLLLCSESGGPGLPLHDVPTEDLKALGAVDVMRGEFWLDKADSLDQDGLEVLQVVKQIASAAHIYGHPIVEMESFTSHTSWQEGPEDFKRLADRAFCEGMTRVVYHTMSHNLPEAGLPGWTYSAGSHMNTHLTWWDMSDQLHAYLARCSAMLMQGHFVADAVYYTGHAIPSFAKPKHVRPGLGLGYDYDDLNTEMLLKTSVDAEGRIVLPSGMRYAVMVLPETDDRMDLVILQHIETLLQNGATVIGNKPLRTYGLSGYPDDQRKLTELADKIWSDDHYGKGRVIVDQSERDVLIDSGTPPDLQVHPAEFASQVDFIHRRTSTEEIYFVRNTQDHPIEMDITFRDGKGAPQLWDAVDAEMIAPAIFRQSAEGVRMPIRLPPRASIFVVFAADAADVPHVMAVQDQDGRRFPSDNNNSTRLNARFDEQGNVVAEATGPGHFELQWSNDRTQQLAIPADRADVAIDNSWEVRFPYGWGVTGRQTIDQLDSWTDWPDAAVRSFSGIATYTQQFDLKDLPAQQRAVLELGEVREVARVYLNGHDLGISSFAPHRLDVTDTLRVGENSLVVEVANTWLNRLIADDALPEAERLTRTNLRNGPTGRQRWKDAQPKPSGLLGPVRLTFHRPVAVQPEPAKSANRSLDQLNSAN